MTDLIRKLSDLKNPTKAEEKLLAEYWTGEVVVIGDKVPDAGAGAEVEIRADLIRYLLLGGCDELDYPVHEKGVQVAGARITGALDLEGVQVDRALFLAHCHFGQDLILYDARLDRLILGGSVLAAGLMGDRLETRGSVVLRHATAAGAVRLPGARVGGDLDCSDSRLNGAENALQCDGLKTGGAVELRNATAAGAVRLLGARVGGGLNCAGAYLNGEKDALSCDLLTTGGTVFLSDATAAGAVCLVGARVGGGLSCDRATFGGDVSCDGTRIDGGLFWRNGLTLAGRLNLTAAKFGRLNDDPACWPTPGKLLLNRCVYGAFTGTGISAEERIRWLELQDPARYGQDFWPQPWEHCAKVLREMGHRDDARKVSIRKEWHQKRDRRRRIARDAVSCMGLPCWRASWGWNWVKAGVLRWSVGYGHAPFRALWWLAGLLVIGALLFDCAARDGQIKPNNAFVLRSPEWVLCGTPAGQSVFLPSHQRIVKGRQAPQDTRLACFHRQPEAQAFPAFNPLIYSIDTLIPLVDLELQDHWLPAEEAGWLGRGARVYLWLHIGLGWALSLLAVAGFTGLVRND